MFLNTFIFPLRTIGDQLGEAKASGNLGNTLKVLGRYDEAAACCQRHLDISRMLHDKVMAGLGDHRGCKPSSQQQCTLITYIYIIYLDIIV